MGNEVHNDTLIRGPESDLDQIEKEAGSCESLTVTRESKHCLCIRNSIRQRGLWNYMTGMLRAHKQCWIRTLFTEEMNGGAGVWIGFYQGEKEVIQSRYWSELCIEEWHLYERIKQDSIYRTRVSESRSVPSHVTNIVENKLHYVGIDKYFLQDIVACSLWNITDHSCKTSNEPLTRELLPFVKPSTFLQNIYCDSIGNAGTWIGSCEPDDAIEDRSVRKIQHHTWHELSKEEIASFEAFGSNTVLSSDASSYADPIEWFCSDKNKRALCARKGDKELDVWFATY